jgi:hypothetical protein
MEPIAGFRKGRSTTLSTALSSCLGVASESPAARPDRLKGLLRDPTEARLRFLSSRLKFLNFRGNKGLY